MNKPDIRSSDSDVSSDSSWTVLDDARSEEVFPSNSSLSKNLLPTESSGIIINDSDEEEFVLTKGLSDRILELSDSNSTIKDFLNTETSQSNLKEDGFLTIDEYVEERTVEHDYEYDQKRALLDELVQKKQAEKKLRKKNKAQNIATFAVVGTVMALAGLSLVCILIPKNTNLKTNVPPTPTSLDESVLCSCPVYEDEDDNSLKIMDERGVLRQFLNNTEQQSALFGQCPNRAAVFPMAYDAYTRTPAKNNTMSSKSTTSVANSTSTKKTRDYGVSKFVSPKKEKVPDLVTYKSDPQTARRKKVLRSVLEERKKREERRRKRREFRNLHSTLAYYILHDIVILNMVYAIQKLKATSQLTCATSHQKHPVKQTKSANGTKLREAKNFIAKAKAANKKSEPTSLKKSLQVIKAKRTELCSTNPTKKTTAETKAKIVGLTRTVQAANKVNSGIVNFNLPSSSIRRPELPNSSTVLSNKTRCNQTLKTPTFMSFEQFLQNAGSKSMLKRKIESLRTNSNISESSTSDESLEMPLKTSRKCQNLLGNSKTGVGPSNTSNVKQSRMNLCKDASSDVYQVPIPLSQQTHRLLERLKPKEHPPLCKFNFPSYLKDCQDCESKFRLFVEKQRDKIKCARQSINQFHTAVTNTTKVIQTCRNLVTQFSDSKLDAKATNFKQSITEIKGNMTEIKKEMEMINKRLDSQKLSGESDQQINKLYKKAARYWDMKQNYLQIRSRVLSNIELMLNDVRGENAVQEIPSRQTVTCLLERIIRDAVQRGEEVTEKKKEEYQEVAGAVVPPNSEEEKPKENMGESLPLLRFSSSDITKSSSNEETRNGCIAKCKKSDLYNIFFGKRGQEIQRRDRAFWAYNRFRDCCRMKHNSKHDPKNTFVAQFDWYRT